MTEHRRSSTSRGRVKADAPLEMTRYLRRLVQGRIKQPGADRALARVVRLVRPFGWTSEALSHYLEVGVQNKWWRYTIQSRRGVECALLTVSDHFIECALVVE